MILLAPEVSFVTLPVRWHKGCCSYSIHKKKKQYVGSYILMKQTHVYCIHVCVYMHTHIGANYAYLVVYLYLSHTEDPRLWCYNYLKRLFLELWQSILTNATLTERKPLSLTYLRSIQINRL